MKELVLVFLFNFWSLINSISVFILLGVVIAGVIKLLIPDAFIKKHLGQHSFVSNIKAATLGIPLPLCSCSVVPFVSALMKGGASKSATQTFLIATPITGADSILATYGVLGWVFTLYRIATSVIIALVAGVLTLLFVDKLEDSDAVVVQPRGDVRKINEIKISLANDSGLVQRVMSYAFDEIYKDIAKSLMIGIAVGALIMTFMPADISGYISSSLLVNYALVLVVSMPLYVCATASIPLGVSLFIAGFSPGAVFIFLTAGPATNTVTMSVVLQQLGKTSLFLYLSSVLLGSLLFGVLFDRFFSGSMASLDLLSSFEEDPGFVAQVSSVVLLYLSFKYIFNEKAKIVGSEGGCGKCGGSDCAT